jgi:hypothetical protein
MSYHLRKLPPLAVLCLIVAAPVIADEAMVANPYYKFWAGSKPGATAVHTEKTKLSGPEGKQLPGGVDEKRIAYKLLQVDKDKAVVEMVVTERDFLGFVQAAPTRYIYPAMIEKSRLERIYVENGDKGGEETVKVGDKELKCKTVSGNIKEPGGDQIEYKLWLSDDVPGKIVKQVRADRQKGAVIAETTTTLESYKQAE